MVVKIYQKIKSKSCLSIEKVLQNEKKRFTIIIRNHSCLENSEIWKFYLFYASGWKLV